MTKPFTNGIDGRHARRPVSLNYERGDAACVPRGVIRVASCVELECKRNCKCVAGTGWLHFMHFVRWVPKPVAAVPDDATVGGFSDDGKSCAFGIPLDKYGVASDVNRAEDNRVDALKEIGRAHV